MTIFIKTEAMKQVLLYSVSFRNSFLLKFIVRYSTIVNTALIVHDVTELSQTPFSSRKGVITNNDTIGNISVPKNDTSIDRIGRSSAVKYDEKHISTHPVR